jgi:hypothetical protein
MAYSLSPLGALALAAGAVAFTLHALQGKDLRSKRPLPSDETGAKVLTDTATEIGLMSPASILARQGNATRTDLDWGKLVNAVGEKGYTLTAEQRAAARFILGAL